MPESWDFTRRLSLFEGDHSRLLLDGRWGLEKEAQRTTASGDLSLTDHPAAFGNKLSNPHITVDFAESQIELITSPATSIEEAFDELNELQLKVEAELGDELLWPLSMPPKLPDEKDIPLAKFGESEEGREKMIYRSGLAQRYGKKMQMVSGIHYNFSYGNRMLDYLYSQYGEDNGKRMFTDDLYAGMARNFLRNRWLLIYLFGASPSIDASYYSELCQEISRVECCCPDRCNPTASYEKYAVSLRVSRFGYSKAPEGNAMLMYNSLHEYTTGIRKLVNDHILQKESEFYSSIRLKQLTEKGEAQLDALEDRGVQYAEVRLLDLNPFYKTGLDLNQLYYLQVFMLYCLLEDSDMITDEESLVMNQNHHLVSLYGRKPDLELFSNRNKSPVRLQSWAQDIFIKLRLIATIMDMSDQGSKYANSVERQYDLIFDLSLLPSSRIQAETEIRRESYLEAGVRWAQLNKSRREIRCTVST